MNGMRILGIISFLSLFPAAAFATDNHSPTGHDEKPHQYSNEGNKWAYEKMMNDMSREKVQSEPKVPHSDPEREKSAFDDNNIFKDRKARTKSIAPW